MSKNTITISKFSLILLKLFLKNSKLLLRSVTRLKNIHKLFQFKGNFTVTTTLKNTREFLDLNFFKKI